LEIVLLAYIMQSLLNMRWKQVAVSAGVILMSFAGLSQAQECTVLEDFSGSKPNSFPAGWKPREEAGKNAYVVAKDGDMFFVRARATDGKSSGNGSEADRPVKWNIEEYPILSWKWRPRVFPRGADEQNGKDDDHTKTAQPQSPFRRRAGRLLLAFTALGGGRSGHASCPSFTRS